MAFEWTERMSVGHADIDLQHQELFSRFNKFLDSCQQATAKEQVEPFFDFLGQYVVTHFQQEEALMTKHRYPRLPEHRNSHRQFIAQFEELRQTLAAKGPSSSLVIQTNQALLNWVIQHIKNVDQQFGAFLKHGLIQNRP